MKTNDERLQELAHELRTPLSALSTAAEVLARFVAGDPAIAGISKIMSRQTEVMRVLVDQLLDVSRLDAERVQLRMCAIDLREVAREAVEDRREELERAGLCCELIVPTRSVTVNGDPVKLGQIVGNLLSNSIKFTRAPGGIYVGVDVDGGRACLRVRDTGVGIPAELLPVIFDRYLQASRGSFGGLGLGLPIVKGLVELHGGEIGVWSDGPGKGCTVTVSLPVVNAHESRSEPQAAARAL